ncbi:MAG: type II toxin-antitoxin system HicB family antitoxin [Eubacteriales bacterium]|nr:type II toxin-antitoxin system HicB family antitoxin [Eubacteriales bacterium]
MKKVYPVVFTRLEDGFAAFVPDMNIDTQGEDLAEAIEMARDAIGIMGIDMEDDNKKILEPSKIDDIKCAPGEIISMVDIDFTAYRKAHDRRTVRRNVSLPSWLNEAADKAGLNVSSVLQKALQQELKTHS